MLVPKMLTKTLNLVAFVWHTCYSTCHCDHADYIPVYSYCFQKASPGVFLKVFALPYKDSGRLEELIDSMKSIDASLLKFEAYMKAAAEHFIGAMKYNSAYEFQLVINASFKNV